MADTSADSKSERFTNFVAAQREAEKKTFIGMRKLIGFNGPSRNDVICARGKKALLHPGNLAFRKLVNSKLDEYSMARSKLQKSAIVTDIVDMIRRGSPEGGFVKEKNGEWYEVGDHIAREKTGTSDFG